MTLCSFALQVLQKTVCEPILAPLAPGFFLALRAAMRTIELHCVLLRIAVQGSPARAAHTNNLRNVPVHGILLLGSTSSRFDATSPTRDVPEESTASREYVSCGLMWSEPLGPSANPRKFKGTCYPRRCQTLQRTRAPHIPASAALASCRQPPGGWCRQSAPTTRSQSCGGV